MANATSAKDAEIFTPELPVNTFRKIDVGLESIVGLDTKMYGQRPILQTDQRQNPGACQRKQMDPEEKS